MFHTLLESTQYTFPFVRMSKKSINCNPHIPSGITLSIRNIKQDIQKYLENRNDINCSIKTETDETIKKAENLNHNKIISNHENITTKLWIKSK